MSTTTRRAHASIVLGPRVPTLVMRCALAVLAGALCWALAPSGFWFAVCLAVGVTAALVPRTHAAWIFAFAIGLTALAHTPDPADWRPYVTLAGIHLVHLFGAMTVVTPARSSLQLATLVRPALGFLVIQVPSQALLAIALALTAAQRGGAIIQIGMLAPVAAGAVLVLALVLVLSFTRSEREVRRRR